MVALIVTVQIKPEYVDDFIKISLYNSENSLKEPGCYRFDVLRQTENDTTFNLYEVYNSDSDIDYHKTTDHYKKWRDAVANIMAQPRSFVKVRLLA